MFKRSAAAAVAVMGMVGAMVASPAMADDASAVNPEFSGVVESSNGVSLDGATVQISAWPSNEVLAALNEGDPVPMTPVGVGTTGRDGRFSVPVDTALAARKVQADGAVNYQALVYGPDGSLISDHSFAQAENQLQAGVRSIDIEASVSSQEFKAQAAAAKRSSSPSIAAAVLACGPIDGGVAGNYWVQVGRVGSSATSGFSASFSYSSSQSSTLGVAVKTPSGSWGASGSVSVNRASSTSTTWPALTGSGGRAFKTQFQYKIIKTVCTGVGEQSRSLRAVAHVGGTSTSTASVSASYCTSYVSGSTFTRSSSTAQTISGGADVSAYVGFDLSAKTGYSTTSKVTIKFTAAKSLCGSQGYPGATPGTLVVK
ncbi:hypothetical protein [Microbacterium istanbulense]|uniref:Uncharacterized protein n=1 Tax=Microbacterium istanbulense TaxID=3122049 RepID=A0ABU8LNJ4_9MICO